MDAVLKLLEELEDILDQSRAVPFSNKVAVDKDEIYDIIAEIRLRLPNDIKQSKFIVSERNKILLDAQKEADELLDSTKDKIAKLVDDHEITKQAYEHSAQIVDNAKKTAKEMRIGATEYADEVLALAENRLKSMMEELRKESIEIDNFFNHSLDVIYENRQELRGIESDRWN